MKSINFYNSIELIFSIMIYFFNGDLVDKANKCSV